jgi:REP element-mobilizing transposase RayT
VARAPRHQVPDGLYHVTTRGTEGRDIYLNDDDRRFFVHLVAKAVERFLWRCYAYCLMSNHFHLMVETPHPNLAQGMHLVNGTYAQWFNDRYDRAGHLFQSRYGSAVIEREPHLLESCRYIVLNPVRAGLCHRAGLWRWSSYRATAGLTHSPAFLDRDGVLDLFADDRRRAIVNYVEFVADGARENGHGDFGHVRGLAPDMAATTGSRRT